MTQLGELLALICALTLILTVDRLIVAPWICRYCGRRHTTGVFAAFLNDMCAISLCDHNPHP